MLKGTKDEYDSQFTLLWWSITILFLPFQIGDPWGGSYLMEALTDQMYESALKIINEVRTRGASCTL